MRPSRKSSAAPERRLLDAAKKVLWERGYSATSPGAVLKASGVGQGSLYHHFAGKPDLALRALTEFAAELRQSADELLCDDGRDPLARIEAYLRHPRVALRGCRLGRFVYDPGVVSSAPLRAPIEAYFRDVTSRLEHVIAQAQHAGQLAADVPARNLAVTLVALVQGAYVVARGQGDVATMQRAIDGGIALLEAARSPRPFKKLKNARRVRK